MNKKCLFKDYGLDGLKGDNKTYSFGQLIKKCGCAGCKAVIFTETPPRSLST